MCNKSTLKILLVLSAVAILQVHSKHQSYGFRRNRNSGEFHLFSFVFAFGLCKYLGKD